MALPNIGVFSSPTVGNTTSQIEDPNKKIRKPYTITKSRESWTEPEHDKFLEALQLFDRDWKKIEAFIGSKTVIQIRSHAQKYFLKVQKSGTNEHLPPPRPKRKAAHPYPQKAPKIGPVVSQELSSFQASPAIPDAGFVRRPDPSALLKNPDAASVPGYSTSFSHVAGVLPDFAQVYSFIGSVFDPNETGHLQKLKMMDPIDIETRRLLSSYEIDPEKDNAFDVTDPILGSQSEEAAA
ncbi:hypothetical protein DH2020_009895 [Rehmannia glutinosa]|uniref:Uncharacterized protein n=1 Tax=Rehmannia glutinosa TaxID=99300 RepID=A0ABR0X7K8_REHGL